MATTCRIDRAGGGKPSHNNIYIYTYLYIEKYIHILRLCIHVYNIGSVNTKSKKGFTDQSRIPLDSTFHRDSVLNCGTSTFSAVAVLEPRPNDIRLRSTQPFIRTNRPKTQGHQHKGSNLLLLNKCVCKRLHAYVNTSEHRYMPRP